MSSVPTAAADRFDRLDALRGLAIVWMAAYHFAFDLNHFGLLDPRQDFYRDPLWTVQRTCIVSLFLFCAGMGQAVALQAGQGWPRFWRRWAQVAGCAVLVSAGSAVMFPRSWIFFGVLHGIAVMLILVRVLGLRLTGPGGTAVLAGVAVLALVLPHWAAHPAFNGAAWSWTGLVTRKPVTEDYVPVLPWLGVMVGGLVAGRLLLQRAPAALRGPVPRALRPLAMLGRWSLTFYMVHQPVFIGALMAWVALSGR